MIKAAAAIVAIALVAVATVSQAQAQATITIGIDADPAGNTAASLGDIQDCRSVAQGDTFEVDVFVKGLPESVGQSGGLSGFSFDLLYDPAIVKINSSDAELLIADEDPDNSVLFFIESGPDSDGDYKVDVAQLPSSGSEIKLESGDGILLRVTMEAVAAGITALVLDDLPRDDGTPDIFDAVADAYPVGDVENAAIAVDSACTIPPALPEDIGAQAIPTKAPTSPAPTTPAGETGETATGESGETATGESGETATGESGETATGESGETATGETGGVATGGTGGAATGESGESATPTPGGTPSSGGAATVGLPPSEGMSLGIDVIPSGSDATTLAVVEPCASAKVGDSFEVDLVIQDVTDLLAWEIGLSYDPAILEVQDRDVQMFQAANTGSSVLDISGETPDSSGRYTLSAVDTSDPPSPDSGSGVLARITFKAIAEGISPISLDKVDLNGDGTPDQGPFLRAHSVDVIGDDDGDTFFDGPTIDAEIRVGEPCPGAEGVEGDQEGPTVRTVDDDGGIGAGVIFGAAAFGIAALIAGGGLAAFLIRRRRQQYPGQ